MKVYQIVRISSVGDENITLETYLYKRKAIDRALKYHEDQDDDCYDKFRIDPLEVIE